MGRRGFYQLSEVQSKAPVSLIPKCGACGLYKKCHSPKMGPSGKGRLKILVVAEAPGQEEDKRGIQLVGNSGRHLMDALDKCGVDMRRDCWLTNALICFTGDTIVESPTPITGGFRRLYSGPLIRIYTASGRSFTGTPNHPILTPSGWIPLGLLNKGDDLVSYNRTEGASFSGTDVKDPPARFEQVFDSIAELGNVHRMIGSRMDFHGDGEDSDVDIVCTDSLLRDGGQSASMEHGGESSLVTTNKGLCDFLSLGTSESDLRPLVTRPLPTTGGLVSCGSDGLSSASSKFFESDTHCLTLSTDGNSSASKEPPEYPIGSPEAVGQRLQSLPGLVSTDHILKIEIDSCNELLKGGDRANGSCHVYNLETEEGFYIIAGGIVAGNCRPPNNKIPSPAHVGYCQPNLRNTILDLQPEIIIPIGGTAVKSLISMVWKDHDIGGMTRWYGWQIPCQKLNAWICPTFHPSYILRSKTPILQMMFEKHIKAATKLKGRPWDGVIPNYTEQVEVLLDVKRAAAIIDKMISKGGEVAFDFENNMLKPDRTDGEIVCCSVCWEGKKTIAFPWHGEVIPAMKRLIRSNLGKIASNMKHEQRWCHKIFGVGARNWVWDTMLAAHWLDNRKGITGLKFQTFVEYGLEEYNDTIEPYLKADNSNTPNRVHEVDLHKLLLYCGLDSLFEFMISKKQRQRLPGGIRG